MTALEDGEVDGAEADRDSDGGVRRAGAAATRAAAKPGATKPAAVRTAAEEAAGRPDADRDRESELDTHADLDPEADPDPDADPDEAADAGYDGDRDADLDDDEDEDAYDGEDAGELQPEPRPGMTPRQARRIRMVTSGVVMVVVGVVLVVRLGNAPSLLTVGLYGIALILSGTAIVLSRRGRTRLATAVLGIGFLAVVLAEQIAPEGS